jgi:hypothetical protein
MLSDPNSSIIRAFGILNTLIAEDEHPWFGIPFPGVYVTDAEGIVTAKFFENHLALRPGVDQLVRAVKGETVLLDAAGPVAEVECEVAIDDTPVAPGILRELRVRFRVPEGQHLYGEPVPEGMVATQVEIDAAEDLIVLDTIAPATRALTLKGTGERLQVFEGNVTLRVPFSHRAALVKAANHEEGLEVTVAGRVRWQSCDAGTCHLPSSTSFQFAIQPAPVSLPRFGTTQEGEMDSGAHLNKMVQRRAT